MNQLLWHYSFCLMVGPVGNGMQNFCSVSQWCAAEFLHQLVVWCRISASVSQSVMQCWISAQSVMWCRISASVSYAMQNFFISQWCDAEFLHQSVMWCRISASVSDVMHNFCINQWCDAEFLLQSVMWCGISAVAVNNWSVIKYFNKSNGS